MEGVEEMQADVAAKPRATEVDCIQPGGYLLELSLDWIVLRASENVHRLLGESHVTLIGEPLERFVRAQTLHDIRNLFSRLSGTTGIARAYAVRLTDEQDLFDVAFQLSDGRVLLEGVPSPAEAFGEAFGSVGGLIAGLADNSGQSLLDGGCRRMRALTGYDRVTVTFGEGRAESTRGAFRSASDPADLPAIVADSENPGVPLFPRDEAETSATQALLRAPTREQQDRLRADGIRSILRVPFKSNGNCGEFCCEGRSPRAPNFELHAAAELFAQLFAMRLEIHRLKNG
jgi:light-regulated signal transduction histidine kinase (bacteriophytochrome)